MLSAHFRFWIAATESSKLSWRSMGRCIPAMGSIVLQYSAARAVYDWYVDWFAQIAIFAAIVIISISGWVVAVRMRRRIKNDLGKTADEGDLTSIETWMKVDEVEEEKHPDRAWVPESPPSDCESTKRDL